MSDFLDDRRKEITDRLKELEPVVHEFNRLEAAAVALAGVGGLASSTAATTIAAAPAAPRRRGPGRPQGSSTRKEGPGRPRGSASRPKSKAGRPKGGGKRAAQALTFVQEQPGITIPELAAKMGIKQTYLYRVLPGLEKEGKLEKKARGWHPKAD